MPFYYWGQVCLPKYILCKEDQKPVWCPLYEWRRDPTQQAVRSFLKPQNFKGTRKSTSGSCERAACTLLQPLSLDLHACISGSLSTVCPKQNTQTLRWVCKCTPGTPAHGRSKQEDLEIRVILSYQWIQAQPELHERLSQKKEKTKNQKANTQTLAVFLNTPGTF